MSEWILELDNEAGEARISDALTGGRIASAANFEVAARIVKDHDLVGDLAEALEEAIQQCQLHGEEYHHRTSEASFVRWYGLLDEARAMQSKGDF